MKLSLDYNKLVNDYNNKHKKSLSESLSESPQVDEMSESEFIERVALIIVEEIKTRSASARRLIDGEKLSATQVLTIEKAILEQAFYTVYAGDYSLITGFNPDQNSLVNIQELRARQFSPLALKLLKNAGLFYAGLDGKPMSPLYEGWWF